MRILFAIPHYFNPVGGGYGSLSADSRPRQAALANVVHGLHATFGRRQGFIKRGGLMEANASEAADVDVVICTTGDRHFAEALPERDLFRHHATEAKPMLLGYECHAVLRDALGQYDYYCYLEDDLLITDPLFFIKLRWFTGFAGKDALLQPNRFEVAQGHAAHKLYIDCNLIDRQLTAAFQDVNDRPKLKGSVMGGPVSFQRVNNPHAGCFFLDSEQMAHWAAQPFFLDRSPRFISGLESAATLGIMRAFRTYKPSFENAGFLEVAHLDNRHLGRYKFKFRKTDHAMQT